MLLLPAKPAPKSPLDSLLTARVRQLLAVEPTAAKPAEDALVRRLKDRFKDYRTRSDDQLKKAVARVLVAISTGEEDAVVPERPPSAAPAALAAPVPSAEGLGSNTVGDDSAKRVKRTALSESLYPSRSTTPSNNAAGGAGASSAALSTAVASSPHRSLPAAASVLRGGNTARPTVRYSNVGGLESHLQEIRELCEYPLTHPEIYGHLGVQPPRGVLLHGPPGCGKTLLAHAIAGELGVAFFRIAAPEIISGMSGESEEKVRTLFLNAAAAAPSIIFIDEIDAITPKRESGTRGMELRIVAQLLTCMDGVGQGTAGVLVIGATNRPDALDPALRRAGRFDREICLGIPDEAAREHVLRVLVANMRISGDFDFKSIARRTPGFVGADLAALTKEAAVVAVNRIFAGLLKDSGQEGTLVVERLRTQVEPLTPEQLEPLYVEMNDFEVALPKVQPSSKREGFATVPSVTWADVGALSGVREELTMAISEPIRCPEKFKRMGLSVPAGVLLFGPPGCGKTLVAKAIASSSGANFISIKGPELLNKYVGESERAVRQVFERARASAPCVVFFDELDALCPRRGGEGGNESGVSERVVNQILTEMDGLDVRRSIFVLAATNRPELIDPAMLRPGRLDRLVYVPLPCEADRLQILKTCARRTPMDPNVDLASVAARADGFSGADLAALVREAAVHALQRSGSLEVEDDLAACEVQSVDFEGALKRVAPSVSERDRRAYARMSEKLSSVRVREWKEDVEALAATPSASKGN